MDDFMQVYAALHSSTRRDKYTYNNLCSVVYANSMLASLNARSTTSKRPQVFHCIPASELLSIRDLNVNRDHCSPDDTVSTPSLSRKIWRRRKFEYDGLWWRLICATGRKAQAWLVSTSSYDVPRSSERCLRFMRRNVHKQCRHSDPAF